MILTVQNQSINVSFLFAFRKNIAHMNKSAEMDSIAIDVWVSWNESDKQKRVCYPFVNEVV